MSMFSRGDNGPDFILETLADKIEAIEVPDIEISILSSPYGVLSVAEAHEITANPIDPSDKSKALVAANFASKDLLGPLNIIDPELVKTA